MQMIKSKEIRKDLNKRFLQMRNHLFAFSITGSQEELHQFRVCAKKIKALISLLKNTIDTRNIIKYFSKIKKIFKRAGIIRAAYIELVLMKQYTIENVKYYIEQQNIIKKNSKYFREKKLKQLVILKRVEKNISSEIKGIQNKNIKHYVCEQLWKLETCFSTEADIKHYHKARVLIKNLLCNYKLFPKRIRKSFKLNTDYLNKLEDTIGKWHDISILKNCIALDTTSSNTTILIRHERKIFMDAKKLAKHFHRNAFITMKKK